jgi:glycosyltransferase involved in cell wall biosynthesis
MILCNVRVLNAPLTGIQRYTQELLSRLPNVEVYKPADWVKGPIGHVWEQTVLPAHILRSSANRKKILWSPSNTGPIAIKNQVVTLHDLATFDAPEGFSTAFRASYAFVLPRLLPRVRAVITVSEFTRQRAIEQFGLNPDRVHAIPLGVDHSRFTPSSSAAIESVKTDLGIPGRYILFLGALSGRKNVARLFQAWQIAQSRLDDDIELAIAGGIGSSHIFDGTILPVLPPRTRLVGRVSDAQLPALLSGASLFAFPSLYEGFGLPPLEAMACGTPVLVSNITSLPEVVGAAARQVNPLSVEDIAEGLVEVLSNDSQLKALSQAGLKQAQSFNWDNTAAKTLEVFENILSE